MLLTLQRRRVSEAKFQGKLYKCNADEGYLEQSCRGKDTVAMLMNGVWSGGAEDGETDGTALRTAKP